MRRLCSSLLGSIIALALFLSPSFAYATTKLSFTGTSSGTMFLSAPPVASGTIILPTLDGGTAYLIDGSRTISTSSPLVGGGALSNNLSFSLDLSATYVWSGTQNASSATSILPNSLGLPSTCSPASVYVNLSGSTAQKLYVCESDNTWVAVGSSITSTALANNFTAISDPTATDDTPDYAVGSRWINTTDDTQFVAVDVSSNAARWFRTDIGNARFSGARKGGVLDLNYYDVPGGSSIDLATQINFWTNSYTSPSNTIADATIERASGENGQLSLINRGTGNLSLTSGGNLLFTTTASTNDILLQSSDQVIVYGGGVSAGVDASATMVIVDDDVQNTQLSLTNDIAGTDKPAQLTMLQRNGTTTTVNNEQLSRITSYGYENIGTSANMIAGTIGFDAGENFTDTASGGNFLVGVTANGTTTAQVRFKVLGDGSSFLTKDDGTNGVEMTTAGVLQKRGTGSIIADAVTSGTPASASAACTAGTINYDADYLYICVATDTWKRSAIATW